VPLRQLLLKRGSVALQSAGVGVMVALRTRTAGASFSAPFWLSAFCAALAPTSIGYQDLAALFARQPGVSERLREHMIASPFGAIHAATFSFSRPIGTGMPEPLGPQPVNFDPRSLDEVVNTAKRISQRPLIVKLSPNVTSIAQMAHVAQEAGADAISLVNTFVAMAIDAETRKPRIANVTAGLSGPAIKPIALRMVYDAAKAVKIPVIGMGGISTAADIVEFILAGAAAVQIGTASYWDPVATEKIVGELETWCLEHNVERVASLTGGMVME